MERPKPSRETKFSGANGDRVILIFLQLYPVDVALLPIYLTIHTCGPMDPFGTTSRVAGPVPVGSRQGTPSVCNCVTR